MTGEGMVVSTKNNRAVVRIFKASACSHDCKDCVGCEGKSFETEVINDIGAGVGDVVRIEGSSKKVISLALLVYMLPVLLFILASLICEYYKIGGFKSFLLFLILALGWFVLIKITNKKIRISDKITEILK